MFAIHITPTPMANLVLRPGLQGLFQKVCECGRGGKVSASRSIHRRPSITALVLPNNSPLLSTCLLGCSTSERGMSCPWSGCGVVSGVGMDVGGMVIVVIVGNVLDVFPHIQLVISVVASAIRSDTYTNMAVVIRKFIGLHCVP